MTTKTRDTAKLVHQKEWCDWRTTKITVEVTGSVLTFTKNIYAYIVCIPPSHVSGINRLIQLARSELAQDGPVGTLAEGWITFDGTTRANLERAWQHLQAAYYDIEGCWNEGETRLVWLFSREIARLFTVIFQRLDAAESSRMKPTEPVAANL